MSTDLAFVGVGPDIVGVVDDLGREPEQASLDRFQDCQRLRRESAPVRWRGHQRATGGTLDRCAHLRGLLGSRGRDAYGVMVNQSAVSLRPLSAAPPCRLVPPSDYEVSRAPPPGSPQLGLDR